MKKIYILLIIGIISIIILLLTYYIGILLFRLNYEVYFFSYLHLVPEIILYEQGSTVYIVLYYFALWFIITLLIFGIYTIIKKIMK